MKFSSAVVLVLMANSAHAFSPLTGLRTASVSSLKSQQQRQQSLVLAATSSAQDEVEALRAAAAKAREDADRLSQELGKSSPTSSEADTPTEPKKTPEELKAMFPSILAESDVSKQVEQWNALKQSQSITKWSQANLAAFPVSLSMLEQRTSLTPETLGLDDTNVDLDDFKYATLYVVGGCSVAGIASLAFLPENIGATLCYFFALIPILFLGIGSSSPVIIANAIAAIKGTDGDKSVSLQERICRHEAAHFCCGYWCGLPVAEYAIEEDVARVEFGCDTTSNNRRGLSTAQVNGLAVTALAGTVGEALKWQSAEGAKNDLIQLENVFRQSEEFIGAAAQQDLTRWGALTSAMLLKNNADTYEKVVEAFSRQASVEECIAILES